MRISDWSSDVCSSDLAAIDRKDWAAAVPLFQKVVAKDDKNADAYNWLGYALRNQGDYPNALIAYGRALAVNPKHRGAHEYLGEAYLKMRSEERRVGKGCVSQVRSRWSPEH